MSERFVTRAAAEADVLAAAAFIADRMPQSDDRSEAISAVVPRFLARGEVDLAAGLADTVDDPHVRDRLLIAVAAKCAELDDDEYAMQLAEAIEEYGLQSQAREAIALIKAAKGDLERAREIAAEVLHPDEVLAGIAIKQAESGDEEAATETLATIDYPSSSAAALMAMAAMRLAKDDHLKAAEYLESAASLGLEIEHEEERIRMLTDIGSAFIDAKRGDKAIETFERARVFAEELDNVHRDSLLAAVAQGLMRAGSVDLADRTLDAVADKTQVANTLLGFAREYWRRDEKDEALEALDEAYEVLRSQKDTETRDSKAKYVLFGSIAAQFAGFEKGERAIEIAEAIDDHDYSMSALSQVAQVLTARGSDEQAEQAMRAIGEPYERMIAMIGMSDAAKREGRDELAITLLNDAVELAEEVPQLTARANATIETAKRLRALGQEDRASEASSTALGYIAEIRGESSRAIALANLSDLQENAAAPLPENDAEALRQMLIANRA